MSAPDEARVRSQVAKLLRLAAPESNDAEPERARAALEAARLIAKHGIDITTAPAPAPEPYRSPVMPAVDWGSPLWTPPAPIAAPHGLFADHVITPDGLPVRCARCGRAVYPDRDEFRAVCRGCF